MSDPLSTGAVEAPVYVVDSHALYWYIAHPERLSPAAQAVFAAAEARTARIVVPAIVVAETYFLTAKRGAPLSPSELLRGMDRVYGFELSAIGRPQLEALELLQDIPEIHDRLIAADALVRNAPVVTKDVSLHRAEAIQTIW